MFSKQRDRLEVRRSCRLGNYHKGEITRQAPYNSVTLYEYSYIPLQTVWHLPQNSWLTDERNVMGCCSSTDSRRIPGNKVERHQRIVQTIRTSRYTVEKQFEVECLQEKSAWSEFSRKLRCSKVKSGHRGRRSNLLHIRPWLYNPHINIIAPARSSNSSL